MENILKKEKIGRLEYFLYSLILGIFSVFLYKKYIENNFNFSGQIEEPISFTIVILIILFLVIIKIFTVIKRFKDLKLNPYFSLIFFIPYLGIALDLYLMIKKGKK